MLKSFSRQKIGRVAVATGSSPPELLSNKLLTALRRHERLTGRVRISEWVGTFAKLLSKEPAKEVSDVLGWYVEHMNEPYAYHVGSAKAFAAKYDWIRQAWIDDPNSVIVSDSAGDVLDRTLAENKWKQGMSRILHAVIQRSMDAYTMWRPVEPVGDFDKRLFRHLVSSRALFADARDFVRYSWMRILWRKVGFQEHCRIGKLVFAADSIIWLEAGDKIAFEWCGKYGRFTEMMRKMR